MIQGMGAVAPMLNLGVCVSREMYAGVGGSAAEAAFAPCQTEKG